MTEEKNNIKTVVRNRKARHDYQVVSSMEAGIELMGCEVKSIRAGKVNVADSYALIDGGQIWLKNLHISPYEMASGESPDPIRPRRLLMHRREIVKLGIKTQQQGMTLVPLSIYIRGRNVKIELGLVIGRKKYDKRQAIAKADADRRMKQAVKRNLDR